MKSLFIFGTRPEAIKLCPVINYIRNHAADFTVRVCVTAQHRSMLDQVLTAFNVIPDFDLNLMQPNQTLSQLTARILPAVEEVVGAERPDMVIVQGDTTTTFAGALAAFYAGVPVGHVEAGLRTGDLKQPFPEELNRVFTTRLSALHFAPTPKAAENLRAEGVSPRQLVVTGNTGIDAVLYVRDNLASGRLASAEWSQLDSTKRLILVTAHRRESFGPGFERICRALARLADRPDVQIIYPVHRNPNVTDPVNRILGNLTNVVLLQPLDYVSFVDLMCRAYLIITDSGGVQEEAPSLGKPILVMREKTERPEAVESGTARLVGTDEDRIVKAASLLLENAAEYAEMTRVHNPYGDGKASPRIADCMREFLQNQARS